MDSAGVTGLVNLGVPGAQPSSGTHMGRAGSVQASR